MGGTYYAYQGGSRILNATRVDQSGADDANVIDWVKTNDFILAVNIHSNGKETVAAQYKLRWRALPAGSFTDMVATGAINYSADTSLVDGAAIAVGGRKCDTQGDTWQAGEEVEGSINSDAIDLADGYESEVHFALDCSGAADNTEYEFELYDDTVEESRGTCGATLKTRSVYYAAQGGSRILNSTRVDQSGADNANVVNWIKTNDFILAVNINSGGNDTDAAQYKLRWRNKTDAGVFADVGATTEISYDATTDLVNGAAILVGGRKCDSQGGDTWQSGEEVEGVSLCDSIDLADEYETEIHFALDCSRATITKEYELELYDSTKGESRGTCGATLTLAQTYYAVQGGSRILNATRVDQSGTDNFDVYDWTKTSDFILAVNINSGGNDTEAAQYKLRWRNKTDGGSFADVGATGAINYNATTDLVNGAAIAVGGRKCDSQGSDSWQAGEEVEGASLSDSIDLADEYESEIHFALDCSGALDAKEYELELWDATADVSRGTCGVALWTSITKPNLGGSRILSATRVDQSGSDDADVTSWTKTNDFILAVNVYSGGKDAVDGVYRLMWRDVTDVSAWAYLTSTGEINHSADTDLVNGNVVVIGERACSTQGDTWQDGEEVEGSDLSDLLDLAVNYETEIHFAIDCSGADDSHQYEFRAYLTAIGHPEGLLGTCGAKITMASGVGAVAPTSVIYGPLVGPLGGPI